MNKGKFISLLLAGIMAFSCICLVSCKNDDKNKGSNNSSPNGNNNNNNNNNNNQEEKPEPIPTTDEYLVKNGITPYKIVIPQNASSDIKFAASELNYFFDLATGTSLEIVNDSNIVDYKGKYLSLGKTKLEESAEIDTSFSVLGMDGYRIQTYGNACIMTGGTDVAVIYSVYGYLALQFNLEIYAENVFTYNETKNSKLINVSVTDIPDIPVRTGGTYLAYYGTLQQMARYRMRNIGEGWGLWGHSHFVILPPEKYLEAHPDWYNKEKSQLAWENEAMREEFIIQLEKKILESDDENFIFMLGLEDNWNIAVNDTQKYNEIKNKYGGFDSAVQIYFLNYVVKKVNAWAKTTCPQKTLEFAMFAYQQVVEPPVKWDAQQGKYVPVSDDLILEPNLAVQLAPILTNVSHSYFDGTVNSTTKRQFEGWSALAKKIQVWAYSTNFADYLAPFNSWGSIKRNYMEYKNIGVSFLFEQGCLKSVPNYMELRQYLVSKLSWDTTLDTEKLILNFMKAYYKESFQPMYDYFTLMRTHLVSLEEKGENYCAKTWNNMATTSTNYFFEEENMPKLFLDQCERLIDKALSLTEDEEIKFRIKKDRMPLRYILLTAYKNYYSSTEYLAMVEDFRAVAEQANFIYFSELDRRVSDLIDSWIVS